MMGPLTALTYQVKRLVAEQRTSNMLIALSMFDSEGRSFLTQSQRVTANIAVIRALGLRE